MKKVKCIKSSIGIGGVSKTTKMIVGVVSNEVYSSKQELIGYEVMYPNGGKNCSEICMFNEYEITEVVD